MRIKMNWALIVIVTVTLWVAGPLFAQEKETASPTQGLDFTAGLNGTINRADITVGDNGAASVLQYSYLALQVDFDIHDYLTLGAVVGYHSDSLKEPVDFTQLPLPLRVQDQSFKSMMFGLRARSEFLSWKDISLAAQGEWLFFKRFEKDLPFQPPVPTHSALMKNSFNQAALELLVQYDGFTGFTLFAGPRLNLIHGQMTIQETIGTQTGEESLSYKQKRPIGLVGGMYYEMGDHFDLTASITLFSQSAISVSLFYIF